MLDVLGPPSTRDRASSPGAACAVVAIDMGYGHLRPARSIAKQIGVSVMHADRPPLADVGRAAPLASHAPRLRDDYARLGPGAGRDSAARAVEFDHRYSEPPPVSGSVRPDARREVARAFRAQNGLGRSLVAYLQEHNLSLVTTFYSPATFADFHGYDRIFCVVTDSDINRVWAPLNPKSSKIVLPCSERTRRTPAPLLRRVRRPRSSSRVSRFRTAWWAAPRRRCW